MAPLKSMRVSLVVESELATGEKTLAVLAGQITGLSFDTPAILSDEADPLSAEWDHYVPGRTASLTIDFKKTEAVFQWLPVIPAPAKPLVSSKKTKKGKSQRYGKDR